VSTDHKLSEQFSPHRLRRRALLVLLALAGLVLIAVLTPGLGGVRDKLAAASPAWLALAVVLEVASSFSYVLMFRPIFCDELTWGESLRIGLAEVGMGSIVPASGAGGLALGAWVLRRKGMEADRIARRSVAFFLIKSSVNFWAVVVIGLPLALHVIGPRLSPWLTLVPAIAALVVLGGVFLVSRLGEGGEPKGGRIRRWLTTARHWIVGGTGEAFALVRTLSPVLFAGAIGYWLFDNAVLWATFRAVGEAPPLSVILIAYLIGQLGGLIPIPGGIGGIEGGLVGTLVVYGAPADATVAAVLAYRLILFWIPLVLGIPAFAAVWRRISASGRA
jgi:uncharacterized membrane protein YbhN (UPF0104 family)